MPALLYKVPEGTWVLVLLSLLLLVIQRRTCEAWADELCLWTVPVVVLFSMSFLTDINLGLRYVLSIAPYVFIAAGKVVPWVEGLSKTWKRFGQAITLALVSLAIASTLRIHPDYLAYFSWAFGRAGSCACSPCRQQSRLGPGPGRFVRGAARAPEQPVGLAYFGQINPSIFGQINSADKLDWFCLQSSPA